MMKTDTIGYVGSFGGESVIVGVTEVADRLLQSHFDPARYHRLCEEARDAGMGIGRTPSEHPVVRLPDSCYWAYGVVVATCDASSAGMGGEGDLLCAAQIVCPMDDPCYGAVVPVIMDGSMTTIVSMGGPWFTAACESIEGWMDHAHYFECGPFAQEDVPWDGIPDASTLASLEEHWCAEGVQPSPAAVVPQRDAPDCKLSTPFRDVMVRLQAKGWPDVIDMAVNAAADWPPMGTFKYTEPGFVAYLSVDRPEVNTVAAFQTLVRDVFRDALAECGVDPDTVSEHTFGSGMMNALIGEPCMTLCDDVWGSEGHKFHAPFEDAVMGALDAQGVSFTNLGYYYYPDEVDGGTARDRDRAAEVYRDAVVIEDFRLTDAPMTVVESRCPSTVADAARSAAGNQGVARSAEPAHRI